MSTIYHDHDRFRAALRMALAATDQGGVMAAVDVIASDARPGELMLACFDELKREWCSDDRRYGRYQDAFMALGRHLDEINPEHKSLSWHWKD